MRHAALDKTGMHPLEAELQTLISDDPRMWGFLQHGSLDGIWYWNLEAPDEEWMSPEFWRLFGIDPATKRHDPAEWQDIIFKNDLALAIENFQRHCADPSHPYDQIVRYLHADGSTVWVRCRGIAIRDDTGKPIRMLGAHNDLTAVKTAEEHALRAKQQVELANAELKSFAYGVSHDLKSPSRTALQLVQEGMACDPDRLSDEQVELFTDACEILTRMQCLIEDLLDYGRLVEDDMNWTTVDLEAVARDALTDLKSEIDARNARIDLGDMTSVQGNPAQLRMLLQNLIANALKYHRPGVQPKVRISTQATQRRGAGSQTELTIADNGCGIAEKNLSRIFDVFTRLHRQDEVPGTGLGLALCNRIASNHNATISVSSKPDHGSTFQVRFGAYPA